MVRCRACCAHCWRDSCGRRCILRLSFFSNSPFIGGQVQSLPGALPAQLVRPGEGKVTWILDADAAAGIAAEKWEEPAKTDFPRSNV